jgi:transposase
MPLPRHFCEFVGCSYAEKGSAEQSVNRKLEITKTQAGLTDMTNTAPMLPSYAGESVYVGIDVHKHTYSVVARVNHTEVKRWTMTVEPKKLGEQLHKFFAGATIYTAYEARFSGFGLHRELVRQGIHSRGVHAAAIEVAANNRVKTDRRDAHKISEQLETGRLLAIRIPSEVEEQRRLLSRTRAQLVRQRIQVQNQIRMKAHQFGLIAAGDCRQMTHSFVAELLAACPANAFQQVVKAHQAIWRALEDEIAHLEAQLKTQAAQAPYEATYRSVPGVGFISARILSNELGDCSQFANERQLFSYTGLTPSEDSTGEHIRRGPITKQGNTHLRSIQIEIAWRAIGEDPTVRAFYGRIKQRQGSKQAIVAVARKLVGRIRTAFRHQELYRIEPIESVA